MSEKPSYEKLLQQIARLEQENLLCRQLETTVRQQEKALKESEAKFRLLFERTPISYQSLDINGNFLEVNQTWLQTLGYTRDEVIGKNFADFLHSDWADHFKENFLRFKSIGEVLGVEFELRKKDGTLILVAFNGKIGKDTKGDFLQTHCVFSDISELRRTELALAESEERYRTIFEQAPIGIVHCALDGRFLKVNERFARIVGYPREELLRMDFKSITFPDDLPADLADIKNLLSGVSRQFSKDKRYVRKDGTVIWGHIKVLLMEDVTGWPHFFLATVSDITERKLAVQALAASERNYRSIFEQAAVGIVNCSLDGRYLRVNPVFAKVIGYSEEELLQMDFRAITHPDDIPADLAAMDRLLSGDISRFSLDKRYICKDGSIVWGSLSTSLIVDENGIPALCLGIVQNIQKRKMMEEALRESEDRLRFALEGANDGLWDANLLTGDAYFSRRSYEILGYSGDEMAGVFQKWIDLVHPDDFASTWQRLVAHFQKQTPLMRVEHRMRMKNGDWKWLLTRGKVVKWSEDGRALRMVGTNTDISENKKIEDAQLFLLKGGRSTSGEDLFQTLARYLAEHLQMDFVCINRLAEDNLSVRTLAFYLDGHFQDTMTYTLQDAPCGDVIGKTVYSCTANVCQHYPDDAMLQEIGAESYVGATLWNSQGKAIGLISTISRKPLVSHHLPESIVKLVAIRAAGELERREAEAEKANLQAQLMQAQKMESVGRLAGGVAHDFNNMLGVILGHAEMAKEEIEPSGPLFEDLSEIIKAAQRSADLTRQLLAFARKQTVSPKVLDLNETVSGLLKMLQRLIGENIDLAWLPGERVWQVKIDPAQVDQILANLAVNARDAIEGVGKITIETDSVELDKDYCTDHMGCIPGSYVMLSVSDDGSGMNKDVQEHIFEPFFTTKEVGKGTGLGLATIYGIVKQNGGYIDVHSQADQGTTFRIYLPRYLGKALANDRENTVVPIQQGQETILLVEDEPSILLLGKRMLESMGYRVLTAGTPGEALWQAEQNSGEIHLLITDVVMPEMNGRDLAKRLLSLYPDLKRLFMSGYTANVIAHHGVLDEGVHFIQKPFSKTELSIKVRDVLRGDRAKETE